MADSPLSRRSAVQTWCACRSSLLSLVRNYSRAADDNLILVDVTMKLAATCALLSSLWFLGRRLHGGSKARSPDTAQGAGKTWAKPRGASGNSSQEALHEKKASNPVKRDPSLLKKHSQHRSYTTPIHGYTYPNIRVFYRPHPQADKLPTKPSPLPLLVFVHGLGGSIAQFHPLLNSLVNLAPCLGIDLPGCGLSEFAPKSWDAYTTAALVELLSTVIEDHRDRDAGQGVVLIGHSMGCSLAALLASSTSPHPAKLDQHTLGLLAICPKASPPTEKEVGLIKRVLLVPGPVFDLWRQWDRRGGIQSKSVSRFVGKTAGPETRKLQMIFNEQSKTPVWRRMIGGIVPKPDESGHLSGGLPGGDVWAGLNMPVLLVAGAEDTVTKPTEIGVIVKFLKKTPTTSAETAGTSSVNIPDSAAPVDINRAPSMSTASDTEGRKYVTADGIEISSHEESSASPDSKPTTYHLDHISKRVLKTTVLPPPAAHALLYTTGSSRILAGVLSDFMATHISPRLSLGWQLQYLSTEGKWDVKNLAKWQAIKPVSDPIAGVFRAMKTLREVDERHRPEVFVQEWSGKISDVIDISHDNPVYDPRGLEKGGVKYHKFPTVSKIPPTAEEVADFISLVDRLLLENARINGEGDSTVNEKGSLIGVHCHYGFNRTGYFIACYLVEKRGYTVQAALDEFERQRPPGIRHDHFIDSLFVRYCVGLKRAPSL